MSKGFPGRLKRKWQKPSSKSLVQVLANGETEPITDDLIEELVNKGWKESDLRRHRNRGGVYLRPRNTVLYPPKFGD